MFGSYSYLTGAFAARIVSAVNIVGFKVGFKPVNIINSILYE